MKMNNMAHRHHRAARKLAVVGPVLNSYVILDTDHRPDLRGEFAGVRVQLIGGQYIVKLTEATARFYLDSGSITPLVKPDAKETAPAKPVSL